MHMNTTQSLYWITKSNAIHYKFPFQCLIFSHQVPEVYHNFFMEICALLFFFIDTSTSFSSRWIGCSIHFLYFVHLLIRRFTHQCSTNLLNSRKRITLFTVIKDNNKQKHISNFHQFKKNTCCADEMEMFFWVLKQKYFDGCFAKKKIANTQAFIPFVEIEKKKYKR